MAKFAAAGSSVPDNHHDDDEPRTPGVLRTSARAASPSRPAVESECGSVSAVLAKTAAAARGQTFRHGGPGPRRGGAGPLAPTPSRVSVCESDVWHWAGSLPSEPTLARPPPPPWRLGGCQPKPAPRVEGPRLPVASLPYGNQRDGAVYRLCSESVGPQYPVRSRRGSRPGKHAGRAQRPKHPRGGAVARPCGPHPVALPSAGPAHSKP